MAEHSPIPTDGGGSPDPLEAELESFRPAELSPGFSERVGGEIRRASGRPSRLRIGLLLGLAAAACAVVAFNWWVARRGDGAPGGGQLAATGPADPVLVATTAAAGELAPPTVTAYRRALAESPAALDALLDAHAARLFPAAAGHGGAPDRNAFDSSRTRLSTSNGDTL